MRVLHSAAVQEAAHSGSSGGLATGQPLGPEHAGPLADRDAARSGRGDGDRRCAAGQNRRSTRHLAADAAQAFPREIDVRVQTLTPNQALAAATASISISHSGTTSALTMIVAEPGRASPKCFARAAPAGATSSGRTR